MEKQEAKTSLIWIERWLESVIAELSEIKDDADGQFAYGEKVAYTECYEKLEIWKRGKKIRLGRGYRKEISFMSKDIFK